MQVKSTPVTMVKEASLQRRRFKIELTGDKKTAMMTIGFVGKKPPNHIIVQDVEAILAELGKELGGELLKMIGPASQHATWVMSEMLTPLYENIAIYDPDNPGFVVVTSRGAYKRGARIRLS
jgi:hypothetical protein